MPRASLTLIPLVVALVLAAPAAAQVPVNVGGLPPVGPVGPVPGGMQAGGGAGGWLLVPSVTPGPGRVVGGLADQAGRATGAVDDLVERRVGRVTDAMLRRAAPEDLRRLRVRQLVQAHPRRVGLDPLGEPVLRGEFLAMAPDRLALEAIRNAGFEVVPAQVDTTELGLELQVIRDTRGRTPARAMRDLEHAAPQTQFAFQHIYLDSGIARTPAAAATTAGPAHVRVGLVDSGVDASHPALAGVRIHRHGCGGRAVPAAHGTAVASRLVDGAGGELYAADLWCGDAVGRATVGLVDALSWLAREGVPVINISLVGPDNPVVARAVKALQARGHVVVAAVGNDGPAAPPLFPAAYADVIGVGAVDDRLRALPESGSGPHVDYVAVGIVPGARKPLRGTSFAAPVVARTAALVVDAPGAGAAARVHAALAGRTRDLGKPGRDSRYGEGLVPQS